METDEEWVDDADMAPALRAKVLALKVLRQRCLAHAAEDTALEMATPVVKMFMALVQNNGALTEGVAHGYVWSCLAWRDLSGADVDGAIARRRRRA